MKMKAGVEVRLLQVKEGQRSHPQTSRSGERHGTEAVSASRTNPGDTLILDC